MFGAGCIAIWTRRHLRCGARKLARTDSRSSCLLSGDKNSCQWSDFLQGHGVAVVNRMVRQDVFSRDTRFGSLSGTALMPSSMVSGPKRMVWRRALTELQSASRRARPREPRRRSLAQRVATPAQSLPGASRCRAWPSAGPIGNGSSASSVTTFRRSSRRFRPTSVTPMRTRRSCWTLSVRWRESGNAGSRSRQSGHGQDERELASWQPRSRQGSDSSLRYCRFPRPVDLLREVDFGRMIDHGFAETQGTYAVPARC